MATQEKFANMFSISLVESAANTLTYKKLESGFSLFEKKAWLIHRLEYFNLSLAAAVFNGTGDQVTVALTVANTLAAINTAAAYADPTMLDIMNVYRQDLGTAASGFFLETPYVKDFSQLPGGGLIVPPSPLYGAIQGSGLASAASCLIRGYFTVLELKPDEYWELVEARRVIS